MYGDLDAYLDESREVQRYLVWVVVALRMVGPVVMGWTREEYLEYRKMCGDYGFDMVRSWVVVEGWGMEGIIEVIV